MAELHIEKLSVNQIKHAADSEYLTVADTNSKFQPGNSVSGSALYDTSGTFTFVVPTGVIKLSAFIGAGVAVNTTGHQMVVEAVACLRRRH